tara:strand:- start:148 stop:852 length:705 start_codon:yes stop_codon:yes gene_type:complete
MFEPNPKMKINVVQINKERRVVVIDDFYKNPDEIRDLALSIDHRTEADLIHNLPGARGVVETAEVKDSLHKVYFQLCKLYFGHFEEKRFNEHWDNQEFMVNVLNDETLLRTPAGIIPHQDHFKLQDGPGYQFGAVVYLNTEEECAGGTNVYSHMGNISIENDYTPQWLEDANVGDINFDYVKSKVDGGRPYACEYEAKMAYNRMVLYQADTLHGQNVDLGMFSDYNRINQVLFM